MLASALVLIALICAGLFIPVPYAEMSPGPTVNTLGTSGGQPVIKISGRDTYRTSGHLNMTTVRVTGAEYRMGLVEALTGWLSDDSVVVPHDTLYPEGTTEEESTQENAEEFSQSQESARVAALRQLGIPVTSRVIVASVVKDSPAQGKLHAGDVIRAVDGTPVKAPQDVAAVVTKRQPGQPVDFTVVPCRGGGRRGEGRPGADRHTEGHHHHQAGGRRRPRRRRHPGGHGPHVPVRDRHPAGRRRRAERRAHVRPGHRRQALPGELTGGAFVAGTGTIDDAARSARSAASR